MKRILTLLIALTAFVIVALGQDYPPYQVGEGTECCFQAWAQNQSQHYPMVKGQIMNIYEKPIEAKDIVIKVRYQGSKTPIFVAEALVGSKVLDPEEWYPFIAGGLNNGEPINIQDSKMIYIDVLYRKGADDYTTLASFMIDPKTAPIYDEKFRQLR